MADNIIVSPSLIPKPPPLTEINKNITLKGVKVYFFNITFTSLIKFPSSYAETVISTKCM